MPSLPVKVARELRQRMTPEEKLLWQELRAHRFHRFKFRRQHPIVYERLDRHCLFYIADFYCAAARLVIELDGKPHQFPDQQEYDRARDQLLGEMGMQVLRIANDELKNMQVVLKKIEASL